jgi:hypothetical protein
MTTPVLELGEYFDVRDMAKKARDAASMFDGADAVSGDEATILLVLNAGLENFLTGEYAVAEPETGMEGEDAVEAWVNFAKDIAYAYENQLNDEGYTTFHEEGNLGNVLREKAEEYGYLSELPSCIENAIKWTHVEEYVKSTGSLVEMFIDGETYVSNVSI